MPQIRQTGQKDGRLWADSMRELSSVFEEQVMVWRWVSASGGTPGAGIAPTDVWTKIPARANISDLSASEIFFNTSDFQAGDLQIELRTQVFGSIAQQGQDGQSKGRKSDQVVYRGRNYYFVGHIHRLQHAGHVYWVGHMRPTGA